MGGATEWVHKAKKADVRSQLSYLLGKYDASDLCVIQPSVYTSEKPTHNLWKSSRNMTIQEVIRRDNASQYISTVIQNWAADWSIKLV